MTEEPSDYLRTPRDQREPFEANWKLIGTFAGVVAFWVGFVLLTAWSPRVAFGLVFAAVFGLAVAVRYAK
jgi:hypothetical protein